MNIKSDSHRTIWYSLSLVLMHLYTNIHAATHCCCSQVRCRTPKELEEGISLDISRQLEAELLNNHEELRHVRPSCKGIPALVRKLISIQKARLEKCLPEIISQVRSTLKLFVSACAMSSAMPDVIFRPVCPALQRTTHSRQFCHQFVSKCMYVFSQIQYFMLET